MIEFLKNKIRGYQLAKLSLVNRVFNHPYFLNQVEFEIYKKRGFVVIKDVISVDRIAELENIYKTLSGFDEFSLEDNFINSGRFESNKIRNFVMSEIGRISKEILPLVFNKNVFDENTTGAFQIKPPSKKSALNPHQDSSVIDETTDNALFVWIPVCDIDKKNGAIWVLPGSHLWGNHQRSLNVHWVFSEHLKTLWKNMIPIYLNKGDILCWDTALIHASSPNFSNQTRVAITTTVLPKNYEMVEYFADDKTPQNMVEKYKVESSFWEKENIMKRPPIPPNIFLKLENKIFSSKITRQQLVYLIKTTKAHLQD